MSPPLRAKTFARIVDGPDAQRVTVAGMRWLLPAGETLSDRIDDRVRLLAPLDHAAPDAPATKQLERYAEG